MTNEHIESFKELFNYIYKGDREATKVSFTLLEVAHTWDSLYDKDEEVSNNRLNSAFVHALVTLPSSPLWGPDMVANLFNVYLRWSDANAIEADKESTDDDLAKAWMLRAGLYDLFVLLAAKLHGLAWAAEIGVTVRKAYGETLNDFLQEIKHA